MSLTPGRERPDGFVLAGGIGRRMGMDKARLNWEGRPMALVVAASLAEVCGRVGLVRRRREDWPIPVVVDPEHEGTHPLFGVAAALDAATTERVVIAPCDVPRLSPASLARLVAVEGPAFAWDGTCLHPLVAVLPKAWSTRAFDAARCGESVLAFAAACVRVRVPEEELTNVNTPAALGTPKGGPVPSAPLCSASRRGAE